MLVVNNNCVSLLVGLRKTLLGNRRFLCYFQKKSIFWGLKVNASLAFKPFESYIPRLVLYSSL